MFPRILLVVPLALGLGTACSEATGKAPGCFPACSDGERCVEGACEPDLPPPADAGVGCTQDGDCAKDAPRCEPMSGQCVQCLADADCRSGRCAADRSCVGYPDSCAVALPIDLTVGAATLTSTTTSSVDDVQPSCALGAGAPDLVYRIAVPSAGRLVAKVKPSDASRYQPVISLGRACDPKSAELACGYTVSAATEAELSVEVTPGDYFLWVDGDSGTAGDFRLTVSLQPAAEGDYCSRPFGVEAAAAVTVLNGTTVGYRDDTFGSCGGTAADVVYELDVPSAVRVQLEVTPKTTGFEPVVYLRRPGECGTEGGSAQLGCARLDSGAARLDLPRLEPGQYFVIVDGDSFESVTQGAFELKITTSAALVAPANDSCSAPVSIQEPAGGVGSVTVTGDTSTALSDATSGGCGGAGPDVVYALHLSKPRKVVARVTPSGSAMTPVLYLRKPGSCAVADPSALMGCTRASQSGAVTTLVLPNVPAGDSYLWIDGIGNGGGAFSLAVEYGEPVPAPANDTCATPQPLTGSGGAFTVTGTTSGAADDASSCTAPEGANSPDVVYRLDVAAPASIALDVVASTGSTLRPVIQLRKPDRCASDAVADEVICAWPDPADPSRVTRVVGSVPAGSYYLWVDGDLTTHGAFQLKANVAVPVIAPDNENCNTAAALTANLPVIGDTRSAQNDSNGWCGSTVESTGKYAPDVVFQFDNPSVQSRSISVVPDPIDGKLFRPVVYVRGPLASACGLVDPSAQVGCAVASYVGGALTLSLPNLAAGSYYVWVDGAAQQSGRFTIKLQ